MSDSPTHDAKALSQRRFGQHAKGYVTSPTHAKGYSLGRLAELIAPQPGQRALDLATGGGHTALMLAQAGAWTLAGDLTAPMLRVAREFITTSAPPGPVAYVQLDAERLPFAPDNLDIVTCRIAPHHFPDVAQFVREMARITRPGGTVAVVDQLTSPDPQTARYVNAYERLRDPSHVWAYSRVEWEGFFTGAGLSVLHYEEFEVEQSFLNWAEMQGNDAPTINRLRALLIQAPAPAAEWMRPNIGPTGDGTFVIRQFLLVARRDARA